MPRSDLREVSYKTNRGSWDGNGYFHQWISLGHNGLDHLYAIIEKEDGSVCMVEFNRIIFKDQN